MSLYCDGDYPEFYSHTEPVARKRHRCCECDAPIDLGETHFACTGKWNGEVQTHRQHTLCMSACMWVRDHIEMECLDFGALFEWWEEMADYVDFDGRRDPNWQPLRKMLAAIKRRERRSAHAN